MSYYDRALELKDELKGVEVAVWLDTLDRLSAAAKKAEEDYASASFVLQQAHDDLDALYRQADQLGEALRTRDGELVTVRLKVNMLSATHQQLDGQMAVLRGNVENNNANISRIEEELNQGRTKPLPGWFGKLARYFYVPLTCVIFVLGLVYHGIG